MQHGGYFETGAEGEVEVILRKGGDEGLGPTTPPEKAHLPFCLIAQASLHCAASGKPISSQVLLKKKTLNEAYENTRQTEGGR